MQKITIHSIGEKRIKKLQDFIYKKRKKESK